MLDSERRLESSAKARQNLQRNEFFRRLEWGRLDDIPVLDYSVQGAIFDAERIVQEREEEEVDGQKVLKFNFTYVITIGHNPPWENALFKLTVDSKTSAKIDAFLNEGINLLDIQVSRTPKGNRYRFSPWAIFQSIPGYRTTLPIRLTDSLLP
jgi:hypothetical protein